MRRLRWLVVIAVLVTTLSAHSQDVTLPQIPPPVGPAWNPSEVDIALRYAKESTFELAFPIFSRLAEEGDVEAQYHLGIMYDYGEGMPPDHKKAFAWRLRAAKSGHAGAQTDLGAMYFNGEGTKPNKK